MIYRYTHKILINVTDNKFDVYILTNESHSVFVSNYSKYKCNNKNKKIHIQNYFIKRLQKCNIIKNDYILYYDTVVELKNTNIKNIKYSAFNNNMIDIII